jgi:microcystin synthetase protein McyJ
MIKITNCLYHFPPTTKYLLSFFCNDLSKLYKSPGTYVWECYKEHYFDLDLPLWLNLGYWKEARTYPEACQALSDYLADLLEIFPGYRLMDAGCGFAQPATYWSRKFDLAQITCVNNDLFQVRLAQERVKKANLESKISFICSDVNATQINDASFDGIVSLESAFHFSTRQDFFIEAYRLLKRGGKFVIADMIPSKSSDQFSLWQKKVMGFHSIPLGNMYDKVEYVRKLEECGFVNIQSISIRNHVYPWVAKLVNALKKNTASSLLLSAQIQLTPEEISSCKGVSLWKDNMGLDDFVIFSAIKK